MYRFLGVGRARLTIQQGAGKVTVPTRVSTVAARWAIGPRSPEWAELWRRIFVHVLYNNEDVTNDAAQGPDEPVDVNTPEQMGRCNGSGGS
jgi:hypothetical protein